MSSNKKCFEINLGKKSDNDDRIEKKQFHKIKIPDLMKLHKMEGSNKKDYDNNKF